MLNNDLFTPLYVPKKRKLVAFENTVDLDKVPHNELPYLALTCLPDIFPILYQWYSLNETSF